MKIDARRLDAVLRSPEGFRAILLYGDDVGLIRARADQVTTAVAGGLDDPFRVAALDRDSHEQLTVEATALAMTGGRRVVRVRDATDTLAPQVQRVLATSADSLLVLEAPELPTRGKLRALADAHEKIASIGCYPEEGRTLEATIRIVLKQGQVTIDPDGMAWLTSHLGADQALTRQELEKLALYVGPGGTADLAAAQACIGDAAAVSLDEALFAAMRGDVTATDRALTLAQAGGLAAVAMLRMLLGHLQRLHKASLAVAGGQSPAETVQTMRPPVFYRRQPDFVRALELWRPEHIMAAMESVFAAEQGCKRTGAPDAALSAHALLAVAGRAAQLRRASRGSAA